MFRVFILFALLLLQGCFSSDPNKYELKSPCVSADAPDNAIQPCARRIPAKQGVV